MNDTPSNELPETPKTPDAANDAAAEPVAGKPIIDFDDFLKLDLRVATITEAEFHPNADRLLKLQLDVGELGPRQICAGIRGHYEPEALVGRQIVIVANLAPRKIRGEVSNGMLLAASDDSGEERGVVLLGLDKSVPAGATAG